MMNATGEKGRCLRGEMKWAQAGGLSLLEHEFQSERTGNVGWGVRNSVSSNARCSGVWDTPLEEGRAASFRMHTEGEW